MKKSIEYIGKLVQINEDKGSGFVKSEFDDTKYYFTSNSTSETLRINDEVAFLLENRKTGKIATAIRKTYTNRHGIKFIPRVDNSHIHMEVDQNTEKLFEKIPSLDKDFIEIEHKFPFTIGKTTCVRTTEDDTILYAIRKRRNGHSRLVLDRKPMDTNHMTGVFKKSKDHYVIITLFNGEKSGKEPYDKNATKKEIEFWENHALIYDTVEIIKESETSTCPW